VRLKVRVFGHVQGVFFRESTRRMAEQLDLAGWVRNLPDGSVEWMADGHPEALQSLLEWCEDGGPPAARVDRVEILENPLQTPLESGFRVLR
jgi:acylphosphatase